MKEKKIKKKKKDKKEKDIVGSEDIYHTWGEKKKGYKETVKSREMRQK